MSMKVFIVDKFEAFGVQKLKELGCEVINETGLKGEALAKRLAEIGPDVLIVRSTKIPGEVLRAARGLHLIVRAGAGVDNIDVATASQLGIPVANCPGMNASAVAELTIGLIVALDRRIPDNVADLRAHKWNKKEYGKALGLKGRTLGVVGAGSIGTEVARRALAFDMNVLFFNLGHSRRMVDYPNVRRVDLDDLMRDSDVVSVHVPGGPETHHLIDARRIALLKPTALLINTSRAGVIDEKALVEALRAGKLRGAASDVYENEPPADGVEIHSPLCDLPNFYGTHHIGASTEQAQIAVAEMTVEIVANYKRTGQIRNCVNTQSPSADQMLVVRFVNKPGGLAHVFLNLLAEEINVEEMDHVVYDGGKAACANIRINKRPSEALLARLREGHPNVLGVEVLAAV